MNNLKFIVTYAAFTRFSRSITLALSAKIEQTVCLLLVRRSQSSNNQGSPNAAYKNFYRQQLDDLVRQKQEQKKI